MTRRNENYGSHGADSPKEPKKKERYNDAVFVNYELDKDAQAACKAWGLDSAALVDGIDRLAEQGYHVSVKWDDYSQSFAAFLRTTDSKTGNEGLVLSGRGSTGSKALKQVMFKHFQIMGERWRLFITQKDYSTIDD